MSWESLGLPAFEAPGYGYTVDAGIVRTPFDTAHPRQTRRHSTNKRTFTATCQLSQAQLKLATNFLETYGFSWFSLDLLSGQIDGSPVSAHCVRLSTDYTVKALGNGWFELTAELEQLVERSILVTSELYPLEVTESAGVTPPDPSSFSSVSYSTAFSDAAGVTPPAPFVSTIVQTVFWSYIYSDSGAPRTDADAATITPPDPWSSDIQQTVFHATVELTSDSATVTPPDPWSIGIEQTVFHLYFSVTEDAATVAPPGPFSITIEEA